MATARTISDQLRDAIRDCGLSVRELGRIAEVDDGVIYRFLSGQRGLTLGTVDRLGEAIGLKLNEVRSRRGPSRLSTASRPAR